MNLGTLTPPRTYSTEPGAGHLFASGCIRGVRDELGARHASLQRSGTTSYRRRLYCTEKANSLAKL